MAETCRADGSRLRVAEIVLGDETGLFLLKGKNGEEPTVYAWSIHSLHVWWPGNVPGWGATPADGGYGDLGGEANERGERNLRQHRI